MKKTLLTGIVLLSILTISLVVFQSSCTRDKCRHVSCDNNGTCTDGTCVCPSGYEGAYCATETRTKFVGTNLFTESCNGAANNPYNITISNDSMVQEIAISNLGNFTCATPITGVMTGSTTFNIPYQTVCTAAFSGSGTIVNNKIVITYTAIYPSAGSSVTYNCVATQN